MGVSKGDKMMSAKNVNQIGDANLLAEISGGITAEERRRIVDRVARDYKYYDYRAANGMTNRGFMPGGGM